MRTAIALLFLALPALAQFSPPPPSAGGTCAALGGDVTGTCAASVVSKITAAGASKAVVTDASSNAAGLDYNSLPCSNCLVERNGDTNAFGNAWVQAQAAVAAAGMTTTLTKASAPYQTLTGTGGQTYVLPNATTFVQTGVFFSFVNNATGTLTLTANGGGAVITIPTLGAALVTNTSIATAAGTWDVRFDVPLSIPAHNVLGNNTGSAAVPNTVRLACADLSDAGAGCTSAAAAQVFSFGGTFVNAGSAIAATTIALPQTAAAGCTIRAYSITVAAAESGTATVKFVRVAAGTASPAIGDSINTSGVSLSSGDHIRSTTVSDFTSTTVTQGDVIAVALTAVTGGLTGLTANVECQ